MYLNKLQMEFSFELMKLFCRKGKNFVGIHCGVKCLWAARVCSCYEILQSVSMDFYVCEFSSRLNSLV